MKYLIYVLVVFALVLLGCDAGDLNRGICPVVSGRSGAYTTAGGSHVCVYYGDVACAAVSGCSVTRHVQTTDGITVTACTYNC